MFTNLVSLIAKSLSITNAAQITKVNTKPTSYNPFEFQVKTLILS